MAPNDPPSDARNSPTWLMKRLAAGDQTAATAVFRQYASRLTALARSRLSKKLAGRLDAEDIVMSAYRSFFVRARHGAFSIERGGDLWRLLVEITLHKLYRQHAFHTAQRRAVHMESGNLESVSRDASMPVPSPEVALAAAEEIESIMAELPLDIRAALEMRFQGHDLQEIAKALDRSERTIRRWLDQCREVMRRRFPQVTERRTARSAVRERTPVSRRIGRPRLPTDFEVTLEFDHFRLIRQIGAGGTGKVYLAFDKRSNEQVAVKFLKKRFLSNPDVISRFVQESHLLTKLTHPGIVQILGLGRTPNGGLFLAMHYVPGRNLEEHLIAGAVQLDDAVRWLVEAAFALEYAHQRGIIHCDLKPSNLLIDDNNHVVLTDFGLARSFASEPVDDDTIAGTPAFMAPEQVERTWGPLSVRTDVYGLGAVLYSLVTGGPPHHGSAIEVLAAIASGQTPTVPATVQPDLAEICQRCLVADPAARFPTAASVRDALSHMLQGVIGGKPR